MARLILTAIQSTAAKNGTKHYVLLKRPNRILVPHLPVKVANSSIAFAVSSGIIPYGWWNATGAFY